MATNTEKVILYSSLATAVNAATASADLANTAADTANEAAVEATNAIIFKADKTQVGIPVIAESETISFAVADKDGNSSWLATNEVGGIPAHSAELIQDLIGVVEDPAPIVESESFIIVDGNDNRSEFALDLEGKISQRTVTAIGSRIDPNVILFNPATVTGLTTIGDSLTENLDADGVQWAELLADSLGLPLFNPAKAGEATNDCAIRSGALSPQITLSGLEIPATVTPVSVTTIVPSTGYRNISGLGPTSVGSFTGVLRGIPGTLERSDVDNSWSFTRTSGGSAITCPAGTRFYMQDGKAKRNDIWILWFGRNNAVSARVIESANYCISFMRHERFLILAIPNNSTETIGTAGYDNIIAVNEAIAAEYPDNYFDIREYLVNDAIYDAGITPTAQDLIDIGNDVYPESLRADSVHPNQLCTPVIASKLLEVINLKGWN